MNEGPGKREVGSGATSILSEALAHDHHERTTIFDLPIASAYSCYSGIVPAVPGAPAPAHGNHRLFKVPANQLWPGTEDEHVVPLAQVAHDQVRAHILGEYYPCIGARAAFTKGTYRFGFYKQLGHDTSVAAMGRDLRRFISEYERLGDFTTFVAAFQRPQNTTETEFERQLFQHLQKLHNNDDSDWDEHYSADPESDTFAFSFCGCAFFIVGFHSGSSRFSRRSSFPMLVFNPESQIRRLKEEGGLLRFAERVRERDTTYQGEINPSLPADADKTGGEAKVYSGKRHGDGEAWKCPFHPRAGLGEKTD